jgi:hypothetical protein
MGPFDGRGVGNAASRGAHRPLRRQAGDEVDALAALLGRLEQLPVDHATAELAAVLGACYRLRAADAVHLATGVLAGANRFITNNRKDFPGDICEIAVTYPDELPVGDIDEWGVAMARASWPAPAELSRRAAQGRLAE